MPPLSPSTGLTITNPLVLYRSLIATKYIEADPAQHRLALHLQKLYYRLKDYEPEIDFNRRLDQLNRLVEKPAAVADNPQEKRSHGGDWKRPGVFSSLRGQQEATQATALTRRLTDHESAIQLQSPQGLLLHGGVGTGKSLLVDLLADALPNRKKRRWHFNTFMLETFARLEQLRRSRLQGSSRNAPSETMTEEHSLLHLARDMITSSPILFLDEFQLPDRAASKILSNLLTSFFHLGGVLIATSNRMPEELANASGIEFGSPPSSRLGLLRKRWGLPGSKAQRGRSENMFSQKSDFAAFLEVLRARCEIWDMEGSKDWRRREAEELEGDNSTTRTANGFEGLEPMVPGNIGLGYEQSLHVHSGNGSILPEEKSASETKCPNHYMIAPPSSSSAEDLENYNRNWSRIETQTLAGSNPLSPPTPIPWQTTTLRIYNRPLHIPRHHAGITKWTFAELCSTNLGPADYITLASTFHTLILTSIPILTSPLKNEARRLITLLDALYESRCKLLISAAAGPDELFFPELRSPHSDLPGAESDDSIHPETISEIHQDTTSPFRPNVSPYHSSSASPPNYTTRWRSVLADEDSDFGPLSSFSGPETNTSSPRVNFSATTAFTGADEQFAYKRARSRLWEMCGARWWGREGEGWWRPVPETVRRWEGPSSDLSPFGSSSSAPGSSSDSLLPTNPPSPPPLLRTSPIHASKVEGEEGTIRTKADRPPPVFSWVHAWGMMRWGDRAGVWGRGVEGLGERKEKGGGERGKGKREGGGEG